MTRRLGWIAGPAIVAAVFVGDASDARERAQAERPPALKAVIDCRTITGATERLACYDANVTKLDQAEASNEVVVLDRAAVRASRRQAFGLSLPNFPLFRSNQEHIDKVEGVVASARNTADGGWLLTLEDGAVWQQTDSRSIGRTPHRGSKVEIKAASMGSYFVRVDGEPGFRAKRTG